VPLRRRLALTVAVVALLVVVAAGAAAWLTTRSVLRGNVDDALRAQGRFAAQAPRLRIPAPASASGTVDAPTIRSFDGTFRLPGPPPRQGGPSEYQQPLTADGELLVEGADVELPVQAVDRAVIGGTTATDPRDVTVGDSHLRMITVPVSAETRLLYQARLGVDVAAVQFARPMDGVDSALRTLWIVLLLLGVVIVGIAALLARTTARRVLRPVTDLAAAAAHVEATEDLDGRLPVQSEDEVGELTRRFNGMLARLQGSRAELDRSVVEQRNLVADASHELRTPVTSLRTNAEVLLEDDEALSPQERRGILADVRDQAEDLGLLVADLIELARGDAPDRGADEPVALDALVEECVGRARRDHRGVAFGTDLRPVVVAGRPDRLARAVQNLLNNAALHGAAGEGRVEVEVGVDGAAGTLWAGVRGGGSDGPPAGTPAGGMAVLRVVDHGPGVPADDRVRIFDRFRRGDSARSRHGSGLGLAIVRQVATVHGGAVEVEDTPGGGATFALRLPLAAD
jgi:two-component system sensor histidine kinase MprB